MKESSLYIHVPYCRTKCLYCDFFSGGVKTADWKKLLSAYSCELRERLPELYDRTVSVYIGGGTPSLMPAEAWLSLTGMLEDMVPGFRSVSEFTIEVNPDDVSREKCDLWKSGGVSRVSMGVQSFVDSELKAIGRRHKGADAVAAYNTLSDFFTNISIDLMFGLPGQTLESWNRSIEAALALSPAHISAYSLMFEEGTAMTVLRNQGRMDFPEESECIAMWNLLSEMSADAGYEQYEISNYARRGFESLHNSRYWLGFPYLGIGPAAHSYDGERLRRENPSDIKGYLSHFCNSPKSETEYVGLFCKDTPDGCRKNPIFYKEELLSEEELFEEMILTRLRTKTGLEQKDVESRFGKNGWERILKKASGHIEKGNLIFTGHTLSLGKRGIMISDDIILDLAM